MKRLGALLMLCACSNGVGAGSPTPFLGKWRVTGNGTLSTDMGPDPFSGSVPTEKFNLVFAKGGASDLESIDNYGCRINWSVNGNAASLVVPQRLTCYGVIDVETGSLQLTPVDADHLSGSGMVSGQCGDKPCSADAAGTFTKVP